MLPISFHEAAHTLGHEQTLSPRLGDIQVSSTLSQLKHRTRKTRTLNPTHVQQNPNPDVLAFFN
jgi:hypothetical protein